MSLADTTVAAALVASAWTLLYADADRILRAARRDPARRPHGSGWMRLCRAAFRRGRGRLR